MDYFLNELSLTKVADRESAKEMMYQFISTCRALNTYGFDSLRIQDSQQLLQYDLCNGYNIIDWRNDNNVEREYKTRFRSLATQSPLVTTEKEQLLHKYKLSEFRFVNEQSSVLCVGLGLAYLTNTISISFQSNHTWDNHEIELNYLLLNDDETFSNQPVNVRHAANVLHLDKFTEWILLLKRTGDIPAWNPPENYFPAIEISDQLIPKSDWGKFYSDIQLLSEPLRIAKYIEIGRKVAERNGYMRNSKISRINNRTIYAAGYAQSCIYLALDTMHGSFEVCNYNGNSIGEYGFHGNYIGVGHDIQLQ